MNDPFSGVFDLVKSGKIPAPTAPKPTGSETPPAADADDIFPTLTIPQLIALTPPEWQIDGVLIQGVETVLFGAPASLKSFLALDWALCIASGRSWKRRKVKQGAVIYIAGEGARGIGKRVRAWQIANRCVGIEMPFRLISASVDLMQEANVDKLVRTATAAAAAEGCDVALIVIDTVAKSIPGADENSAQEMGIFVAAIGRIRAETKATVLGIHHSGKERERGARGSSALKAGVDTEIELVRSDEDKSRLTLHIHKQKDEDEGDPIPLKAEIVDIGAGQSSLVLMPDEEAEVAHDERTALLLQIAALLGRNGRLNISRVCAALGIAGGHGRAQVTQAAPIFPNYAEVETPDGLVRLSRARNGSAPNSPIDVIRTDLNS